MKPLLIPNPPDGWRFAKVGEALLAGTMFFNDYTKNWEISRAVLRDGNGPMKCNKTKTFIIINKKSPWSDQLVTARRGLSQRQAAAKIAPELSVRTLQEWEAGRCTPPAWVRRLVLARFGINMKNL